MSAARETPRLLGKYEGSLLVVELCELLASRLIDPHLCWWSVCAVDLYDCWHGSHNEIEDVVLQFLRQVLYHLVQTSASWSTLLVETSVS